MASVDECLREASDCVRHAEQCGEEGDQAVFMLMAKSWMRLAVQIDEIHPSPSLAADDEQPAATDDAQEAAEAGSEDSIVPAQGAPKDERL